MLEKYHETLACILLLFNGIDAEKAKVSETISEVVNLVMDAHGVKKGVTDLLLPTTYQELLKSMCVPDWVLLYFKFKQNYQMLYGKLFLISLSLEEVG